jgi:hypothetical protein
VAGTDAGPRHRVGADSAASECGSAVVEYVLVSVLVVVVFLAVAQVALLIDARDVLVADAAEGARTAALRDSSMAAGENECSTLVHQSLAHLITGAADPCTASRLAGEPQLIAMRIQASVPMTLVPFAHVHLNVLAHAVVEPES